MATEPGRATTRLIELAERLTPSGEIGDGMVQQFHEAAALARLEQHTNPALMAAWARYQPAPCTEREMVLQRQAFFAGWEARDQVPPPKRPVR